MWSVRNRTNWAIAGAVALFVVAAAWLVMGGQSSRILSTIGASVPAGAGNPGPGAGAEPGAGGDGIDGGTGGGAPAGAAVFDLARPDLLILRTGTIDLQVDGVEAAVAAAEARIVALGGYVSGSEQVGAGDDESATITYRIPADQWLAARRALRELAIRVVSERSQTEDVTGQVVDLRARIANLEATERALQAIMAKATIIDDVLDVQAELTSVRGEIEEAVARRQHLEEQAAYSTLVVRFGLEPEPAVVVAQDRFDPASEVDRATASLVEILQRLATAGIWFGIVWLPILLALGLIGLIAWFVVRRVRAPDGWRDVGGPPQAPSGPPAATAA